MLINIYATRRTVPTVTPKAILMAVDGGHIDPGETVIAMSADTAIVARSSLSTWLFHPTEGLEINEIICKPSKFTITHSIEK